MRMFETLFALVSGWMKGQMDRTSDMAREAALLKNEQKQRSMIEEREAESADWSSENPKLREPFATSSQSTRGSSLFAVSYDGRCQQLLLWASLAMGMNAHGI